MPDEFSEDGIYTPTVKQKSLYDYIAVLPSDISDFIWEREKNKTGIDYNDKTALVTEWDERDVEFMDKYYQDTKKWDAGDKEDYRRGNPDADAALYFWGIVSTLQSLEAYDKVAEMMKQIDMPMEELDGFIYRPIFKLHMEYTALRDELGNADSKAREQFRYDNKLYDAYKVYVEGGTPILDSGWDTVKLSEILGPALNVPDAYVTSDKEPRDINVIWIPIPSHTNLPDNIQPLWDEYDSLRKPPTEEYPDGQADSAARKKYRETHPELDAYGIEQGWWKEPSGGGGGVPGPVFDTSEFLK